MPPIRPLTPPRSTMGFRALRTALVASLLVGLPAPSLLHAQMQMGHEMDHGHTGHEGHAEAAPVGVMGDHILPGRTFMTSYRFMRMEMDGNRNGSDALTTADVLGQFMVAPTRMTMDMHMLGAMYAPSDRVTLTAMLPVIVNGMDHETRMGGVFSTESSGFADIRLGALLSLVRTMNTCFHLNLGVSLPTGSIESTDVTPASAPNEAQLPYPMQIGSGTVDLLPGFTYLSTTDRGFWGLQTVATLRMGENDRGWTRGNALETTAWAGFKVTPALSASLRLRYQVWGDFEGADPAFMNPNMVQTVRTDLQAGQMLTLPLGASYRFNGGILAGHRLAVEMSVPLYRDLDGPQLETDWALTVGWRKMFSF